MHGHQQMVNIKIRLIIFFSSKNGEADFPGGSDGKVFVYNVGDLGSIPGLGSSPEKEMATLSSTLA